MQSDGDVSQRRPDLVVGCEGYADSDGPFNPVHCEALEETSHAFRPEKEYIIKVLIEISVLESTNKTMLRIRLFVCKVQTKFLCEVCACFENYFFDTTAACWQNVHSK